MSPLETDPRVAQYEAEREALAALIHKRMLSSYIGPPRPLLLGDAERAAAAVVWAGWLPPAEEFVYRLVRADGTPLAQGSYRSQFKALYPALTSARRARATRRGSRIERAGVHWEETE